MVSSLFYLRRCTMSNLKNERDLSQVKQLKEFFTKRPPLPRLDSVMAKELGIELSSNILVDALKKYDSQFVKPKLNPDFDPDALDRMVLGDERYEHYVGLHSDFDTDLTDVLALSPGNFDTPVHEGFHEPNTDEIVKLLSPSEDARLKKELEELQCEPFDFSSFFAIMKASSLKPSEYAKLSEAFKAYISEIPTPTIESLGMGKWYSETISAEEDPYDLSKPLRQHVCDLDICNLYSQPTALLSPVKYRCYLRMYGSIWAKPAPRQHIHVGGHNYNIIKKGKLL